MERRLYVKSKYRDMYGLTLEELAKLSGRSISYVGRTLLKIENNGDARKYRSLEEEGMWVLPCSDCVFFNNCTYERKCKHDVKTGNGLEHFRDKKEKVNIIDFLKKKIEGR